MQEKNTDNLIKQLKEIKLRAKKHNKKIGFFVSTTTKKSSKLFIVLPIRESEEIVFGGVTVYDLQSAKKIIDFVKAKVDLICVDAESKIVGLEKMTQKMSSMVHESKFNVFKNNDITVDSLYYLIFEYVKQLNKKTIAIVGTGNIASKTALKFVECELNIKMAGRNFKNTKKITDAINQIKTKNSIKKVIPSTINNIAKNSDVLIGLSNGVPVINEDMVNQMKKNGIIIDAGTGTVFPSAIKTANNKKIKIIRVDIRNGFFSAVNLSLFTKKFLKNSFGAKTSKGIRIISGGIYGNKGDVIVNDINAPTSVIGVADGRGGLISKDVSEFNERIDIIKKTFAEK